ncbi:MAG: tRNA (guanine(46)-N(7))-methyltransferase TrmB [Rubrimonas sp.]|uniref:tRNA (guanine(46)-N(7))-methyltransferase TrmB n=1 Tax=Rubrimonas sp. TaxID=2036015 RepID=UPI002FDC9A8A
MTRVPDREGAPQRLDGAPWRNLYGRRRGKTLRARQAELLDTLLPTLALPGVDWEANPERRPLDLAALAPQAREVRLEIGFGGGEHLLAEARAEPDVAHIGCETFVNGVAMCLSALDRAPAPNVRLHAGDARFLFDVLPEGSLARVSLLYPDPWPKRRHWERRFVNPDNLDAIARLLRPGGEFRVATDIDDYARHTLMRIAARPEFLWLAERPDDWRRPWPGWPGTRYEAKALRDGRAPSYLRFARR